MNMLRIAGITLLVVAAAFAALLIPFTVSEAAVQPTPATGATITLVDSLLSHKATIPQREEVPIAADIAAPTLLEEKLPSPPSDKRIVSERVTPVSPEPPVGTQQDTPEPKTEQVPPSSDDSVASTTISTESLPSLVDGFYEATSVDQGPVFDRTVLASRIRYPALAKRQGIEGLVMLRLFISVSGKVERIEVEEDPGYDLAQAAVKAFTGLQGKPAQLGGKAVPVTLRYPVRFRLK